MNKFYLKKNKVCPAKSKRSRGFTIIETMISISIFLVVVTIGVDSLLSAMSLHQKSRDQRSIMDNLNFIMEDMSRNIRTGYTFKCVTNFFNISEVEVTGNEPQDCPGGGGAIVFENASGLPYDPMSGDQNTDDQWVYKIESTDGINFNIWKSTDGARNFTQLNPNEIKLSSQSGFYVTGAESFLLSGEDKQQPLVTIRLIGKIITKQTETPFSLQTTVSQRVSDQ